MYECVYVCVCMNGSCDFFTSRGFFCWSPKATWSPASHFQEMHARKRRRSVQASGNLGQWWLLISTFMVSRYECNFSSITLFSLPFPNKKKFILSTLRILARNERRKKESRNRPIEGGIVIERKYEVTAVMSAVKERNMKWKKRIKYFCFLLFLSC